MISKAITATDQFFREPAELRLYWEKERARMDQRERELCVAEENLAKGLKQGREEGVEVGLK